jgi:hypothetical protein
LLIVGDVKVLFVRVSDPAMEATSASDTAVFSCASVVVTVLEEKEKVLFVNVCAVFNQQPLLYQLQQME